MVEDTPIKVVQGFYPVDHLYTASIGNAESLVESCVNWPQVSRDDSQKEIASGILRASYNAGREWLNGRPSLPGNAVIENSIETACYMGAYRALHDINLDVLVSDRYFSIPLFSAMYNGLSEKYTLTEEEKIATIEQINCYVIRCISDIAVKLLIDPRTLKSGALNLELLIRTLPSGGKVALVIGADYERAIARSFGF